MADHIPPSTPEKETDKSSQSQSVRGQPLVDITKRSWSSVDFSCGGGVPASTIGSSPNQKVAKKLVNKCVRGSPSKPNIRKSSRRKLVEDDAPEEELLGELPSTKKSRGPHWSAIEKTAVLQFVHAEGLTVWTQTHDDNFWERAAKHIKAATGIDRKASAVRTNVTKSLMKECDGNLELTLRAYNIVQVVPPAVDTEQVQANLLKMLPVQKLDIIKSTLSASEKVTFATDLLTNMPTSDKVSATQAAVSSMPMQDAEKVADEAFYQLALQKNITSYPRDFATVASDAMVNLQENNKPNIVYNLAKCLGTYRTGTTATLMPMHRMPYGLIEYQIQFFASPTSSQLNESKDTPSDFRQWHQMMAVEFGERFTKLFRGPAWSGMDKGDQKWTEKARVNVACVGHKQIIEDLKELECSIEPEVQISALQQLKAANPNGRFWIKADATDIKAGLQESMTHNWNGDVNLLDGELEAIRKEYDERRQGACSRKPSKELEQKFKEDLDFLKDKLEETVKMYRTKFAAEKTSKVVLKDLNWQIVELVDLIDKATDFQKTYSKKVSIEVHAGLREDLSTYLRDLFMKKRERATHVMVFMVSEERRAKKPYAMPVLYVPYKGMNEENLRRLTNLIRAEMQELDMEYAGMVTDGEFSTLRRRGDDGEPIHLFQVIQNLRLHVGKLKETTLLKILTKCGEKDGRPVTEVPDASIPDRVINKLHKLQTEGCSLSDALTILRADVVPPGYKPKTWKENGTTETKVDKMKSLVLTYRFRAEIKRLKEEEGRDFTHDLCVPEVDPATGKPVFARADHNHLLKRIAAHTRDGGPDYIDVRRFEGAVKSKDTDLNLPALLGHRKQSTVDAEKFLSHLVADFFITKGYTNEARYVRTIAAWHESTDGRGMSQSQRKAANEAMLSMIMDEWMPWHSDDPDLTNIDVNVRPQGLCGFSAETIIEVTMNIVTEELRRTMTAIIGYPEHPRGSTTDDNECFFALLHRVAHGQHSTAAQFKYRWRQLVLQFMYRMDGDLPFYVWTLNERFTLEEQPTFDEEPDDDDYIPRLHCLVRRRREDSSIITGGRSMMPVQHSSGLRHRLYRLPVDPVDVPEELVQHIREVRDEAFVVT